MVQTVKMHTLENAGEQIAILFLLLNAAVVAHEPHHRFTVAHLVTPAKQPPRDCQLLTHPCCSQPHMHAWMQTLWPPRHPSKARLGPGAIDGFSTEVSRGARCHLRIRPSPQTFSGQKLPQMPPFCQDCLWMGGHGHDACWTWSERLRTSWGAS
jgi:hypothetical protein